MSRSLIVNKITAPILVPLFLIFLVLKMTDLVQWSWWAVTAPIWGGTLFNFVASLMLPKEDRQFREEVSAKIERQKADTRHIGSRLKVLEHWMELALPVVYAAKAFCGWTATEKTPEQLKADLEKAVSDLIRKEVEK